MSVIDESLPVADGVGRRSAGSGAPVAADASSWLLKAKVRPPELPAGHVTRQPLLDAFEGLLARRLTVLLAPGGFGKTTALAAAVRVRQEQGVVAAWLSLDDDDTPSLLASVGAQIRPLVGG